MGSSICTAGFPSAAISSNCFTARCDSIWYGFFIATLSFFSAKENCSEPIRLGALRVATFYDLPGIPRKKFDLILFWSLDRFSREGVLETLQHLQRLNSHGVDWFSYKEEYLRSIGIFKEAVLAIL